MKIKITASRFAVFPIGVALFFCFIVIGAPLEKRGELPLSNVVVALISLAVGCAIGYATCQNQIVVGEGAITFKSSFSEKRYAFGEIEEVDFFFGPRNVGRVLITAKGKVHIHSMTQFRYKDALPVLKAICQSNPGIKQKMGVKDVVRFKPDQWSNYRTACESGHTMQIGFLKCPVRQRKIASGPKRRLRFANVFLAPRRGEGRASVNEN